MQKTHFSWMRVVFGIGLVIIGFSLIAIILNPRGLVLPSREPAIVLLIVFSISTMIALGSYLMSGLDLRKILEPFVIVWLWVIFWVLPIVYLPLPKDALYIILGFSTFIPLLLWIGYTKLKAKIQRKNRREE